MWNYINKKTQTKIILYSLICFLFLGGSVWSNPMNKGEQKNDSIPILIPYQNPAINRKPTLKWHKVPFAVEKYAFQIANISTFDSTRIFIWVEDTVYTTGLFLYLGPNYWRVSLDLENWSEVDSFFLADGRIPNLIQYQSPTIERKPVLKWNKPSIPVKMFKIHISQDSLFNSIAITDSLSDTTYTCKTKLPLGKIFWRIKALDDTYPEDPELSKVSTFFIEDGRIPTLIQYESPTYERKPTLKWNKPPLEVTSYTIEIASDSLFTSVQISDATAEESYTCKSELTLGKIYWRIKSDDAQYSLISSFEIKDTRIPLIVPIIPKLINNSKPVLTWSRVQNAKRYTIEIDNSDDFNNSIITLPVSDTFFLPFEPLPFGPIYWRVKSDQINTWSDIDHFIIITDTIPFLDRYNGEEVTHRKPKFIWNTLKGATSYKFLLADNRDFSNARIVPLEDTLYTPPTDLAYGKWFWKVSSDKDFNAFCLVDSLIIIDPSFVVNQNLIADKPGVYFNESGRCLTITIKDLSYKTIHANVYDLHGRIINTLKPLEYKQKSYQWDYSNKNGYAVPSGLYLIRVQTDKKITTRKVFIH